MATNNIKAKEETDQTITNLTNGGTEQESSEDNSDTYDIPNTTTNSKKKDIVKEKDTAVLQFGKNIFFILYYSFNCTLIAYNLKIILTICIVKLLRK